MLVLRSMPGAAHTSGADIYKEIHFSLDHIQNSASRAKDEINGVLVHEMVHCYQCNGKGKCPGGLVEGIAGMSYRPCYGELEIDSAYRLGTAACWSEAATLEGG